MLPFGQMVPRESALLAYRDSGGWLMYPYIRTLLLQWRERLPVSASVADESVRPSVHPHWRGEEERTTRNVERLRVSWHRNGSERCLQFWMVKKELAQCAHCCRIVHRIRACTFATHSPHQWVTIGVTR